MNVALDAGKVNNGCRFEFCIMKAHLVGTGVVKQHFTPLYKGQRNLLEGWTNETQLKKK